MATPLIEYLKVQQGMDLEIRMMLERSAQEAEKALLRLEGDRIGTEVRRSQIRSAQAAINRELSKLYSNTGDIVRANQARAAAAAVKTLVDPVAPLFEQAGMDASQIDAMMRSQQATAARGVANAATRVSMTSRTLSEKVYHSRVLSSGQLNNIINSGIARGVSASELAASVKDFIRPDTPGGVQYAANRLARTELNNAFHGTQVQEGVKSPFVNAMRWHLSGSHPRPDECNDYESGGDLKDGLWSPERVPGKPHPQCLCWMSAEVPSREDFLKQFESGAYNDYLVENGSTPVPGGAVGAPSWASKATPPDKAFGKFLEMSRLRRTPFDDSQHYGISEYVGNAYTDMNGLLRGVGTLGQNDYTRDLVKNLDGSFDDLGSVLPEDLVLKRGIGNTSNSFNPDRYQPGEYVVEAGYSSSTLDSKLASKFADGGWVMNILAPKGKKPMFVDVFGEAEILIPRNARFKVSHVDKKTKEIWMEWE